MSQNNSFDTTNHGLLVSNFRRFGFLLSILLLHTTCNEKNPNPLPESSASQDDPSIQWVTIKTPKGNQKVWTQRLGANPKLKVLLLHGGPGCAHDYMECFNGILPSSGIEIIQYDQLGAGNSDNPADTSLWNLDRFVDELEQVRNQLHLDSSNCILLGHSWGGILAMEYALKYQTHIKGLIISNMMSDARAYDQYAMDVLAKQLPPKVLDTLMQIEKSKDFSNPRYEALLMPHFYNKHICRIPLEAWPEPINRTFEKLNKQQYVHMQGPSEFGIAGNLENWSCASRLKELKLPTLVVGATYDTMDPKHMEWMSKQIAGAKFLLCKNGSHMSMWDDQQTYMQGIIQFLNDLK